MERKDTNRANHLAIETKFQKGVSLIDIDSAIADYMASTVIPDVTENGNIVKVPLIYGNAERWEGARKNGYLRDVRGRIQIPLVMFKRNTIERNENIQHFREGVRMPAMKLYSSTNRYDRFSLMNGVKPSYEQYDVAVPSYVTVTYEVMIWTNFTEHMNQIVEQFQYFTDRYWGNVDGFKFRTRIESFDNQQEVGEGTERIIRTQFTMAVNAYLLPEQADKTPVVKKTFTTKRVLFGVETDLTGGTFTQPTVYNEYKDVIDFIAIRGSQLAEFLTADTVKLTNVILPLLPPELNGTFDTINWFRVYINGDYKSPSFYKYSYNAFTNEITFQFFDLGFNLESTDEVAITGKFQQL
jgi:hypothetical protein